MMQQRLSKIRREGGEDLRISEGGNPIKFVMENRDLEDGGWENKQFTVETKDGISMKV
jgi:hypothetical protein